MGDEEACLDLGLKRRDEQGESVTLATGTESGGSTSPGAGNRHPDMEAVARQQAVTPGKGGREQSAAERTPKDQTRARKINARNQEDGEAMTNNQQQQTMMGEHLGGDTSQGKSRGQDKVVDMGTDHKDKNGGRPKIIGGEGQGQDKAGEMGADYKDGRGERPKPIGGRGQAQAKDRRAEYKEVKSIRGGGHEDSHEVGEGERGGRGGERA